MKTKLGVYHKLGNLRITAPTEEVDAFIEWLDIQNCYVYGYEEIQAISGFRSIEMSIDIFGFEK